MNDKAQFGHNVGDYGIFSEVQQHALNERWINTLEEFVASQSSEDAMEGILRVLGITSIELKNLLDRIKEILGEDVFSSSISGSNILFVDGVRITAEQKKRLEAKDK